MVHFLRFWRTFQHSMQHRNNAGPRSFTILPRRYRTNLLFDKWRAIRGNVINAAPTSYRRGTSLP